MTPPSTVTPSAQTHVLQRQPQAVAQDPPQVLDLRPHGASHILLLQGRSGSGLREPQPHGTSASAWRGPSSPQPSPGARAPSRARARAVGPGLGRARGLGAWSSSRAAAGTPAHLQHGLALVLAGAAERRGSREGAVGCTPCGHSPLQGHRLPWAGCPCPPQRSPRPAVRHTEPGTAERHGDSTVAAELQPSIPPQPPELPLIDFAVGAAGSCAAPARQR